MTTVESRVLNPVTNRATSIETVNVTDNEIVDTALKEAEESKILEDEEIDSCEGDDLEEQMLNVALVKSVVDSGSQKKPPSPTRYGLRKRRRPGDSARAEPGESDPNTTIKGGREAQRLAAGGIKGLNQVGSTAYAMKEKATSIVKQEAASRIGKHAGIQHVRGVPNGVQPPPMQGMSAAPQLATSISRGHRPVAIQSKSFVATKPTVPLQTNRRQTASVPTPLNAAPSPIEPSLKEEELVPTSGAVPNPLLQTTPQPGLPPSNPFIVSRTAGSNPQSSVPCPLPAPVPCPLQAENPDFVADKRVTINEPAASVTRSRLFSVDLDPSTFDFADLGADHQPDSERHDADMPVLQRDRAFSFEFFNFAGDELLPSTASSELPDPSADLLEPPIRTRPRGDSLIFDPVSFQDGGIHEKNALLKVRGQLEPPPALLGDSRMTENTHSKQDGVRPASGTPNPLPSRNATSTGTGATGQMVTLPSALNSSNSNVSTPATFQMELLNKDGRIGIYLPEARRARIARFHAKRKMRIWRKRIKYDCRKKLADSRPRIKGRFVKRSDMD